MCNKLSGMKILEKMGWTRYGKIDPLEITVDIVIISVIAGVAYLIGYFLW